MVVLESILESMVCKNSKKKRGGGGRGNEISLFIRAADKCVTRENSNFPFCRARDTRFKDAKA